ncbi:MAG: hypothetical protein JSV52_13685 [Candidatus Zixiibacteriota bacterium]|nr:MAG: hypothetical protein JSV52_13685 [candidate division Zixibacteria bacterium]
MERTIDLMLSSPSFFLLTGLLATALFFLMVAIRDLMNDHYEGFMYLPLAMFFGAAHGFYLWQLPIDSTISILLADLNVWTWMVYVLAPTLVLLFVLLGAFNLIRINVTAAMVKIFFGVTLVCYLFMLGTNWPTDVKGIITVIYCLTWFHLEFETAQ